MTIDQRAWATEIDEGFLAEEDRASPFTTPAR